MLVEPLTQTCVFSTATSFRPIHQSLSEMPKAVVPTQVFSAADSIVTSV